MQQQVDTERRPEEASDAAILDGVTGGHGGRGGRRRSAYATRNLTEGSIPRNLFFLAWPQMTAGALQTLDQIADLFWAGFIGTHAIASIGVAQSWTQLVMTGRQGLDTSTRAMVARAVGAGNIALANHVAMQAIFLSTIIGFIMATVGIVFTEVLLRTLGASEELIAQGALYMRVQFLASLTRAFLQSGSAILQASGDTLTPMKAQLVSRVLHLGLSPLLVFGVFWFPELGLAGAALGNALAQTVGAAMNFRVLFTGRSRLHLSLRTFRLDWGILWRQIRIGAPSSVTQMERSMANLIVVGLITSFGDLSLAAYSITQRLHQFVNLGSQGLGQASGVLVGQNLGAQQPERARATVWWALAYVAALKLAIASVIFLFPVQLLSIFTRDAALMEVAVPWLQIQILAWMVGGAGMVFQQTFNTAGDTFIPMVVILGSMWFIELPLAIMLSGVAADWTILNWLPALGNFGQFGIAWAIVIAMGARMMFYFPYFLWGPWMKKQVL